MVHFANVWEYFTVFRHWLFFVMSCTNVLDAPDLVKFRPVMRSFEMTKCGLHLFL